MQCDFSALISPAMFEEFFIPEVRKLCRHMDYAMYHLDGPDAIRHLDLLLAIPELRAIQWVPGSGSPPTIEWLPLLKRIQHGGKSVYAYARADRKELETIFENLDPAKLHLYIGADSPEQADDIVKLVERLSKNRGGK